MNDKPQYHVIWHGRDVGPNNWHVKKRGNSKPISKHPSRVLAFDSCKRTLKQSDVVVVLHNKDGSVLHEFDMLYV